MSTPPTPESADEIDRSALAALVRRFRHLHGQRLARTGSRLMERQRRVLEALPMLYHRNHPALPGYVGPDAPCGIASFHPGRTHLAALQRVARSYQEPVLTSAHHDLQAMFIMGSSGTVGQSRGSDIDLWVCCDSMLHSALWPKVRMIDQWAGDVGLELHSFLVDPEVLRLRRRLPGTRTPRLLLDEFYRSAALVAGRYPLWWLIANDDPAGYAASAQRLLKRRFVAADAVIDFGPVPPFPPDELAQAAIAELDRALTTPHKSLLKLTLMEAYARAPHLGTVSAAYKRRVHAGESDPLRLDPYLLLYDHVERYLEHAGRGSELEFVRGLLIGKAAENTRAAVDNAAPDDRALLNRFLGWGFSRADITRFRSLDIWPMGARLAEHDDIMAALGNGLELVESLVTDAAGSSAANDATDPAAEDGRQLHWLNETRLRHLHGAIGRMSSIDSRDIPLLHPALIGRRRLVPLHVYRDADGWICADDSGPLMQRERLVELAVWSELNGAQLIPLRPDPTLTRNLAQILQGFRGPRRETYVFANAESDDAPRAADSNDGLLDLRREPLRYVGAQRLPLDSLDVVSRGPHGHWRVTPITATSHLDGIGHVLAGPPDRVAWHVIGAQTRFATGRRLEELHALAERVLAAPGALFALSIGGATLTIRRSGREVEVRRHADLAELQEYVQGSGCALFGFDPVSQRLKATLRAG